MKLFPNPNFSIILPGPCNANCSFCFWRKDHQQGVVDNYIEVLRNVLIKLPDDFWQISLTGGEPTISPWLDKVLAIIDKKRFQKVVFTTNGVKEYFPSKLFLEKVNHVNISRHWPRQVGNEDAFNVMRVIRQHEIKSFISYLSANGIDSSISCVYNDQKFSTSTLGEMVTFTKDVGAIRLCMRNEATSTSTLAETKLEKEFDAWPQMERSGCPVCRSNTKYINGLPVTFKSSLLEPSDHMDDVYELIFHPNGVISSDWAGKKQINLKELIMCGVPEPRRKRMYGTHQEMTTGQKLDAILNKLNGLDDRVQSLERTTVKKKKNLVPRVSSRVLSSEDMRIPVRRGGGCGSGGCGSGNSHSSCGGGGCS